LRVVQVLRTPRPGLVGERVPELRLRQKVLDGSEDEVERREALLSVHELPPAVLHRLHDDRLEVVL